MQEQIDNIMDNFNFRKVAEAMDLLEWKWSMDFEEMRVPTESEIRMEVRNMLRYVVNNPEIKSSMCGGFEITNNEGNLELRFVLTSWGIL